MSITLPNPEIPKPTHSFPLTEDALKKWIDGSPDRFTQMEADAEALKSESDPERFADALDQLEMNVWGINGTVYALEFLGLAAGQSEQLKQIRERNLDILNRIYRDSELSEHIWDLSTRSSKPETEAFIDRVHIACWQKGLALPDEQRAEVVNIEAKMLELGAQFGRNMGAEGEHPIFQDPKGEPAAYEGWFKDLSKEPDRYVIPIRRNLYWPLMRFWANSEDRHRIHSLMSQDQRETNIPILVEYIKARRARTRLLNPYAALNNPEGFFLEEEQRENLLNTPEHVDKFLQEALEALRERVKHDFETLRPYVDRDDRQMTIYDYFRARERAFEENDITNEAAPYLDGMSVMEGLFQIAQDEFGVQIRKVEPQPELWNQDVIAYELSMDGVVLTNFYHDPYESGNKQSGNRIMSVEHSKDAPRKHIISTTFVRGEPLSITDVRGLAHELGHLINFVLSSSRYVTARASYTVRDFVQSDVIELSPTAFESICILPENVQKWAKDSDGVNISPQFANDISAALTSFRAVLFIQEYMFARAAWELYKDDQLIDAESIDSRMREIVREIGIPEISDDFLLGYPTFDHYVSYGPAYYTYLLSYAFGSSLSMMPEVTRREHLNTLVRLSGLDDYSAILRNMMPSYMMSAGMDQYCDLYQNSDWYKRVRARGNPATP